MSHDLYLANVKDFQTCSLEGLGEIFEMLKHFPCFGSDTVEIWLLSACAARVLSDVMK